MALLVTGNRNYKSHFEDTDNVFDDLGGIRKIVVNGAQAGYNTIYLDRFNRCIGHFTSSTTSAMSGRWDPELVDGTSANVGMFTSPVGDAANMPFYVGDYEPATTTQRLYQSVGAGAVQELNMNDPTLLLDSDVYAGILDHGGPDLISPSTNGFWLDPVGNNLNWILFPELEIALIANCRVFVGTTAKSNTVVQVDLTDGFGTGAGIPSQYGASPHEFNRGPIFGETSVTFKSIQFLPDPESTHNVPLGEIFMMSSATADPADAGRARLYVQFHDWNPLLVTGTTPNRIHLRQTLLSRFSVEMNSVPTGEPPVPIDGSPILNTAAALNPNGFFSTLGSKRMQFVANNGITLADTVAVQVSKAAIPALITPPAPKGEPNTNTLVEYQAEVNGDLAEIINNASVTWSIERMSTEAEVLATTPTPGETVVVDNFPINRAISFPAGFDVFEDGIALVEGGGNDYTVVEATGSITFISPKPLSGGEVYTITYAHTEAPATPAHGTLVDANVFTDLNGFAIGRVRYPDDDTLEGHLDKLTAVTPT